MYTIPELRRSVDVLYRTRRKLESIPEINYNHEEWYYDSPYCGTVACTLGWAMEACPDLLILDKNGIRSVEEPHYTDIIEVAKTVFAVPRYLSDYLFLYHISFSSIPKEESDTYTKLQVIYRGSKYRFILPHDGRLSTAIARVKRVELWMRRRLAIMEVEYDNSGKVHPAYSIPVGREREEILTNVSCS